MSGASKVVGRTIEPRRYPDNERSRVLRREWIVTNGLGGYASGTLAGLPTRRYHGLLVAALAAPLGRRVLLPHVFERVRLPDGTSVEPSGDDLVEFRLEMGLPIWTYELRGTRIERRVVLVHEQNTVHLIYRLLDGPGPVRVKLLVAVHNRPHEAPVDAPLPGGYRCIEQEGRYEVLSDAPPALRFLVHGRRQAFTIERTELPAIDYALEASRGYEHRGKLWSPGYFRIDLAADSPAALVASTESWKTMASLGPEQAIAAELERRARRLRAAASIGEDGLAAELVLAADQFLVSPIGRSEEAARMHAEGDEVRSIIAGYHWFTEWGRDTMISLDGLTLSTGRHTEAGYVLRMFAHSIRDGLLPNLFPEGEEEGLYHTADATLWLFHALDRYLRATSDQATLAVLLPKLVDVAERHVAGTRFGIGVDPDDGLLRQGQEGYQLTWMDAKVGDWVVTPRRGKAVEINALWYNAMCLLSGWLHDAGRDAESKAWTERAASTRDAFNRRFWYERGGWLHDVVDGEGGDDASLRPNQVLAISPAYPVLEPARWRSVLETVRRHLLTPFGLRTLAPDHPDYRPRYYGDLRSRDAAYHQGTVWPWLLGPFVDAWLKAYPDDRDTARSFVSGFDRHLDEDGVGTISEIFDAEPPFTPRGCIAQAWSVAEILRCRIATAPPQ